MVNYNVMMNLKHPIKLIDPSFFYENAKMDSGYREEGAHTYEEFK